MFLHGFDLKLVANEVIEHDGFFSSQTLPGKVGESTLTPDADTDVVPPPTPGVVGVFKNSRALDGSTLFENFVSFLEETVAQTLSK